MDPNKASRTAEYMALYRAMESARPRNKRLFTDPFAIHFLRPSLRRVAELCGIPYLSGLITRYVDCRAPGARTSAIARTHLIDDLVLQASGEGIQQIVNLGAGYDCRIFRLSDNRFATAFEVDHPATIAVKHSTLCGLLAKFPANVRFVEIDLERQGLAETLQRVGFDSAQPAIFLWEGVTNYLTASAVDAVLSTVAGCGGGTRLVFTYVHRSALDGSGRFPDAAALMTNVARLGEPWTFGLIPEELPSYLRERGLRLDCDYGARQYRSKYLGKGAESMRGYDFYHVAVASVPART